MEVLFTPDIEAELQHLAQVNGKTPAQLVETTVTQMLEDRAQFLAAIDRGIAAANRGEVVDHSEAVKRIDSLFHPE